MINIKEVTLDRNIDYQDFENDLGLVQRNKTGQSDKMTIKLEVSGQTITKLTNIVGLDKDFQALVVNQKKEQNIPGYKYEYTDGLEFIFITMLESLINDGYVAINNKYTLTEIKDNTGEVIKDVIRQYTEV